MFETPPLEELRGKIKPTALGLEAGEAGMPPPDSTDDPHERPIVEEIERLAADARSRLDGQLDQARKGLAGMDSDAIGAINGAVKECESQFNGVVESRRDELRHKRLELDKRQGPHAHIGVALLQEREPFRAASVRRHGSAAPVRA